MKPKTEIQKQIDQVRVREGPPEMLSQHAAVPLNHEVYIVQPIDGCKIPPDWEAITEYAKQHPEAWVLLWLDGEIKEL